MSTFTASKEDHDRANNAVDVSSLSNPSEARATHLDLKVELDFDKKTISGTAAYAVDVQVAGAKYVAFDCKVRGALRVRGGELPERLTPKL